MTLYPNLDLSEGFAELRKIHGLNSGLSMDLMYQALKENGVNSQLRGLGTSEKRWRPQIMLLEVNETLWTSQGKTVLNWDFALLPFLDKIDFSDWRVERVWEPEIKSSPFTSHHEDFLSSIQKSVANFQAAMIAYETPISRTSPKSNRL